MSDLPDMTPAQDTAFRNAIANYTHLPMITGYAIVAEAVTSEGEPSYAIIKNQDMPTWTAFGLLQTAAIQFQTAALGAM